MCVAIPGEIIEINGDKATISFSGNKVSAYIGLVDVKVGDYALVHAGCIIQTLKKSDAEEMIELMSEM